MLSPSRFVESQVRHVSLRCHGRGLVLLLLTACSTGQRPSVSGSVAYRPGAPRVAVVDSVVLVESDNFFLGSPGTQLAVDEDGYIYVPDRSEDRVLRFHPDGTLDRVIGARGDGPGELRGVGSVIFANSELVAVNGYRQLRVSLFESQTGKFVGSAQHQGSVRSLHIDGGSLWYGTMGNVGGKAVGRVEVKSLEGGGQPEELLGTLLDVPEEFRAFPGLDVFDNAEVWADSSLIIVGFGGLDYVLVAGVDGHTIDTLQIPAAAAVGCRRASMRDTSGLAMCRQPLRFQLFRASEGCGGSEMGPWYSTTEILRRTIPGRGILRP